MSGLADAPAQAPERESASIPVIAVGDAPAAADTIQCRLLRDAIDPALAALAPLGIPSDDRARRMLLAIAGQESDWQHRRQFGDGPARGLWQFERGGGVLGVLTHRATVQAAARFAQARGVQPVAQEVWEALEHDDVLAAGFARLLLWCDPAPLPEEEGAAWRYYLRTWRPGKPAPARWPACWKAAGEALFRGAT